MKSFHFSTHVIVNELSQRYQSGQIDALALRQFQSCHRSPSKGFKPVPDGFKKDMARVRKVMPNGESA